MAVVSNSSFLSVNGHIARGGFPARVLRTVSELLHERRPVTPDMAIWLGKLLGNGPEIWLRMQQTLDLWELEQSGRQ